MGDRVLCVGTVYASHLTFLEGRYAVRCFPVQKADSFGSITLPASQNLLFSSLLVSQILVTGSGLGVAIASEALTSLRLPRVWRRIRKRFPNEICISLGA